MATTGVVNGTLFGVYMGGTLVANATEGSISLSQDLRDTTTKDSLGWKSSLPALRSASGSCSGVTIMAASKGIDDIFTAINDRTSIAIKFSTEVSGDTYFYANAYLTSLELSAPTEDNTTFSMNFEFTGALVKDAVS